MSAPAIFGGDVSFVDPLEARPESTAVVVTDMQLSNTSLEHGVNRALDRIRPGSVDYIDARVRGVVLPAVTRLLRASRERGVVVIYLALGSAYRDLRDMTPRTRGFVRRLEAASGIEDILWRGDPGYAFCPEIAPRDSDIVVRKTAWGAFNSSALEQVLRDRRIDTILMSGVTTNCCVETTARDAADRGYGVAIVEDCVADFDLAAHQAALDAFRFNFGHVLPSVESATTLLDASSGAGQA
ncbi:cysteine hydrolase family protein [Nocardioides sp.]|uniref:cysteine hydrolase family protein n=1 Tax=Nocardioides sp. TaxID=35761 RepID=UPI003783BFBB